MRMTTEERVYLLLSVQRALIGEITNNMRAVTVIPTEGNIEIVFIFSEPPSETDSDAVDEIHTRVLSDYEVGVAVSVRSISTNSRLPQFEGGIWVFQRQEVFASG